MTNRLFTVSPALVAVALIAAFVLAACDNPPKGTRGGRIGLEETTAAETGTARALPTALTEFSDEAAVQLVQDLQQIPQIASLNAQGTRATVLVGDILNKTQITSTNDFELIRSRLRNNLLNSNVARERLAFVEMRQRMSRVAQRERVAEGGFYADPADYDPRTTFALNGDFYRIDRGDRRTSQYYMEFQLVSFASNEIVWSSRYDVKQAQ